MTMSPSPGTSGSHVAGLIDASLTSHAQGRELHAEQVAELAATKQGRRGRLSQIGRAAASFVVAVPAGPCNVQGAAPERSRTRPLTAR
ncbi:MAG: hypothetical protein ABIP57_06440 [Jatrophihabitantaceae bacterium]